jgi:CRP/FNR family transcriptional regulator, cyclic AMP receptor protein
MSDPRLVSVLDVDPELGHPLEEKDRLLARRYGVATLRSLGRGRWDLEDEGFEAAGHLGLLVVDGLISREVQLANSSFAELLGQGDVLRPWNEDVGFTIAHYSVGWRVLEPAQIAVLDRRFAAVAARWPELVDGLFSRMVLRSRSLAFHLAITHLNRVDVRLLVSLWFLAERWGRVGTEGVVLPLRLNHTMLARLVGAQRPTVTSALGELQQAERVSRRADGSWLLHGGPPEELRRLRPAGAASTNHRQVISHGHHRPPPDHALDRGARRPAGPAVR